MYEEYRRWRTENLRACDGIIVGSDLTQEWLLPWWWDNYQKHNGHPVAFVDFGMSSEKKEWCKERGEFIPLQVADIFVAEKEEIDAKLFSEWENQFGKNFWNCRNAWFKKPLACLQSPFKRTVWIDLDCEIRGPIGELFECDSIALLKERWDAWIYNSGVIAFTHGLKLIETWADQSFEKNQLFRGDQELLSQIIREMKYPVKELDEKYNWSRCYGDNTEALIYHWHGELGRNVIRYSLMSSSRCFLSSLKNPQP